MLSDYEHLLALDGGRCYLPAITKSFASLDLSDVDVTDKDKKTRREASASQAEHANSECLIDTEQV